MKKMKIIVLILIVFMLVTGCSVTTLDNNYKRNIDVILSGKNNAYNVNFDGYKYYVPRGMYFIDKNDYNAILKDTNNNKYYLYVDAISYYHKEKNKYKVDKSAYYSKKLNYNNKSGYIQIDEIDYKYLVQYVFNHSKVECYVSKKDLVKSINNMSYLLRSIKFNDKVLDSLIGENALSYKEETYSLFDTDKDSEDFLDVVYKNEDKAYKKAVDEDKIKLDDE